MSALDDAIAFELSHPAGGMADPLTDSLFSQATQPAPLRDGWQAEPIPVPLPWPLCLLALLVGCFVLPHLLVDRTATPRSLTAQTEAQALAASGVR